MSETKWTAGPWFTGAQNDLLYVLPQPPRPSTDHTTEFGPEPIAKLGFYGRSFDEERANAHLIAAAPELYHALDLLHDNIAEYARINNLGGFDNQDMKIARAALAKARGEQS